MGDAQVQWFERHRYFLADEECAEFYTSSVGVKAQSYEPTGGASVAVTNTLPGQRYMGEAKRWDDIRNTLAAVDRPEREVLRLVYEPHSWETWLASALAPASGRGSFVLLAATQPCALAAWRKAFPDDPRSPSPEVVLTWVLGMGRALDVATRLGKWVGPSETARTKALAVYDVARRARVGKAQGAEDKGSSEARYRATRAA